MESRHRDRRWWSMTLAAAPILVIAIVLVIYGAALVLRWLGL
jgi:hypothetical protein